MTGMICVASLDGVMSIRTLLVLCVLSERRVNSEFSVQAVVSCDKRLLYGVTLNRVAKSWLDISQRDTQYFCRDEHSKSAPLATYNRDSDPGRVCLSGYST